MRDRRRRRRVLAAAFIALAIVMATSAVILQAPYWVSFLALLVGWAAAAWAGRNA